MGAIKQYTGRGVEVRVESLYPHTHHLAEVNGNLTECDISLIEKALMNEVTLAPGDKRVLGVSFSQVKTYSNKIRDLLLKVGMESRKNRGNSNNYFAFVDTPDLFSHIQQNDLQLAVYINPNHFDREEFEAYVRKINGRF